MTLDDANARLFLALWPSLAVRRTLALQQSQWTWPAGAALVAPPMLHLTLHFIGAVPAARVPELAAGLHVKGPRFTLALDTPEVWPNRCAVLCAGRTPAALLRLHAALAQALRALQLPVESRPLRAHVTLARRAAGAVPPEAAHPLHWPLRGYALVRSAGGRYTPIARYG